jgi:hypothetical protein
MSFDHPSLRRTATARGLLDAARRAPPLPSFRRLVREPAVRHPASFGSVVGFDWGSVAGQLENKSSSRPRPPFPTCLTPLPASPSPPWRARVIPEQCPTAGQIIKGGQADDPSHHRSVGRGAMMLQSVLPFELCESAVSALVVHGHFRVSALSEAVALPHMLS